MRFESVSLDSSQVHKLLSAASGDAALLYLYLQSGNDLSGAATALKMGESRLGCAAATLRQLGLWQENTLPAIIPGEKPAYSEADVLQSLEKPSFRSLSGEVQRRLGRTMNTEELKILLGFVRYLGLPEDVICVLVSYCQERARQKGHLRNPSLRTIEKEAYAWAEQGIDTMEAAAAFIQAQNVRNSRVGNLLRLLQIRGRSLTPAEEKYAQKWLEHGISDELITMAYERTCLNTGGLNWAYMNKILARWYEAGFRTAADVRNGDQKRGSGAKTNGRSLDSDEQAAIARLLQEG
jgi:DnaD/phage-associated family protein